MSDKSLYQRLVEAVDALPKEAVERSKKDVTRKGYDTTGYQYQFLVNVLNEVVGIGNWGFSYKVVNAFEGSWGKESTTFYDTTVEVSVWLMDGEKKAEMTCIGGHQSKTYADSLKGAITNGFKKTIAFFGVGKKAYEGTIDEDYQPLPDVPKGESIVKNLGFCDQCNAPKIMSKKGTAYCGAKCWLKPVAQTPRTPSEESFAKSLDEMSLEQEV